MTRDRSRAAGRRRAAPRADRSLSRRRARPGPRSVPDISVVTSAYNGLPYLRESLRSVLKQSHRDFELIVVDDGSTDGSWDVLCEFRARDPRIVLLRNETNSGYARSQNRAIAVAKGRYIALQDQDDVSHPDRLRRQFELLEKSPAVGVVGAWPRFIDERGALVENASFVLLSRNEDLQKRLLHSNCFCGPSVMMRRSALERAGGYDPELRSAEDYDLLLRLAEVGELANLPGDLYHYRQHQGSVSKVRRAEQMRHKAVALERAIARRSRAAFPSGTEPMLARDFLRAAFLSYAAGDLEEADRCLDRAVAYQPRLLTSGTLVEEVVGRYLLGRPPQDAIDLTTATFAGLLPPTRHLSRVRSRILSRLHMREVFEGEVSGAQDGVLPHLAAGILADPRWLLNRGVVARLARHLLHAGKPALDPAGDEPPAGQPAPTLEVSQ